MTHTTNYNLSQWDAADRILRTDFNADNAKIDAALRSLSSSVSGKASASTVNSLSQTVAQHTTSLAKKGNCLFYATSYTGKGTYGDANRCSLSFPHKPWVVFVTFSGSLMTMIQGAGGAPITESGASSNIVYWSGNSVQWFNTQNANWQMNRSQSKYFVVALLDAEA